MKLGPEEELLSGGWENTRFGIQADATQKRIDFLVANHLEKLEEACSDWGSFYRDPEDGRIWKLSYPNSELHGGGPAELRCLGNMTHPNGAD